MRKALILALIAGMLAGATVTADAKKRKPRPVTMKYFLHYPADSAGNCGTTYMDLKDTPDSGCGYIFQPANEALHQTGSPLLGEWPASGGFPFKLNTAKPLTGEFQLMNFLGLPAQGYAILDYELSGTVGGKPVTLAKKTLELAMVAPGSNVAEIKVKLPKKLHNKPVTGLHLTTNVRGASNFHYFELDENGAFIQLAGLK